MVKSLVAKIRLVGRPPWAAAGPRAGFGLSIPLLSIWIAVHFAAAHPVPQPDPSIEQALAFYTARQFQQAEDTFRRVLKIEPANLRARIYLARTLIQADKVPEALRELQNLLDQHPDDPEAQFHSGRLLQQLAESRF